VTPTGPARIVTVWDRRDPATVPPDAPDNVISVSRCTACGAQRVEWTSAHADHTDPWKHHFDYCDPSAPGAAGDGPVHIGEWL